MMIDQKTINEFSSLSSRLDITAYHFKAACFWMKSQFAPGIAKFLRREMNERWGYASCLRSYILDMDGKVENIPPMPAIPVAANRGTINAELQTLLRHDESTYIDISKAASTITMSDPVAASYLSVIGNKYAGDIKEVRGIVDHTKDNMIQNLHLALIDKAMYEKYKEN